MSNVLAIGDVHCKIWMIDAVEKIIENYDNIVFVGDYADDFGTGPARTIATWVRLREFQQKYPDKVHLTMGNHDYIYTHKTSTISSGYSFMTQMLLDIPENKSLKSWLAALPITRMIDGVTYSHAGINVFWANGHDLWDDDSPLWTRPGDEEYQDIPQVFGHTPSKTCWEVQHNVWCIDTFSTTPAGENIGDQTVLKITDGKIFNKIKSLK